jgi:hypothetical protein
MHGEKLVAAARGVLRRQLMATEYRTIADELNATDADH